MSLEFLNDKTWDYPFYKRLARNDTGEGPGHQGGIYINKTLRKFFPTLAGQPTADKPTVERSITAILMDDINYIDTVKTRYQIQTWHATRSPESRLTSNLKPL